MQPLNIKPTYNNIIVEEIEEAKTTESGLYIQSKNSGKTRYGFVVAIGDGKIKGKTDQVVEFTVKLGDKVLYGDGSGTALKIEERNVLVMTEDDILAIVD